MSAVLRATAGLAAVALTSFWATAGRVLFAGVERWLPSRNTLRLLPWIVGCAFVATAIVPTSLPLLAVAPFALAGVGCSALHIGALPALEGVNDWRRAMCFSPASSAFESRGLRARTRVAGSWA